jgi:hypothetical protein
MFIIIDTIFRWCAQQRDKMGLFAHEMKTHEITATNMEIGDF